MLEGVPFPRQRRQMQVSGPGEQGFPPASRVPGQQSGGSPTQVSGSPELSLEARKRRDSWRE